MHGIIFSTPMVERILDKAKWQTRRLVAPGEEAAQPFGPDGETLWVREGFNIGGRPGSQRTYIRYRAKSSEEKRALAEWNRRHELSGAARETDLFYEIQKPVWTKTKRDNDVRERWRTARFMPTFASRIHLLILGQSVESLQDITEDDARDEGVEPAPGFAVYPGHGARRTPSFVAGYQKLWRELHREPGTRWEDNPRVRVIKFQVLKFFR